MNKKACFVSTTSITMKCFIVPIAQELSKTGVDVTLICSNDDSLNTICEENDIKYHPIYMGRGIDRFAFSAIKELYSFFKAERFDLVQYCTPNAAFYSSIAAKFARIPIRLYCQWGIRYTGFSGFSRKIFKFVERLICELSTDIRAVSWKNRDFAISEKLYGAEKASVIGNGGTIGVDLAVFDINNKQLLSAEIKDKYQIPKNDFVFGFCGRLTKDKGCNELLAAFKELYCLNDEVKLLVIGDVESNSGIDSTLLNWAKESSAVIFTGKIAETEINKYYAPMNVLVHPTYREGFGMVIQEAGAYGIPCITTDVPGASEVMVDKESCIIIKHKDIESLKTAMDTLLNNAKYTRLLGENAYIRTTQLYARPIMMNYQKADYLNLLNR